VRKVEGMRTSHRRAGLCFSRISGGCGAQIYVYDWDQKGGVGRARGCREKFDYSYSPLRENTPYGKLALPSMLHLLEYLYTSVLKGTSKVLYVPLYSFFESHV